MAKRRREYEVLIEDVAFPGMGVGKHNDREIYVKNAVPGQKVKVSGGRKKKGRLECQAREIIEEVDYKIEPLCSHFNEGCGGCSHQFIDYSTQLNFKERAVLNLFKQKKIESYEYLGIEESEKQFQYRNKMEFTFGDLEKGGELTLGMHAKGKSFGILTVDKCQLVDNDFRLILDAVLQFARENNLPHYRVMSREGFLRNLVVRKGENTKELMVNLVTTTQMNIDFTQLVEKVKSLPLENELVSFLHTSNDSLSEAVIIDKLDVLYGRDYIYDKLFDLKFKITPMSFFQTNTKGAERLYSIVKDFMGDSNNKVVFDLYCGTGTIGQIVAPEAKKVIGIELVEEAVESAKINSKLNNLNNTEFIAGDVGEVIKTLKVKPDIIIVDPPRAGVSPKALDYLVKFNAKEIIYVSCNPVSLVDNLVQFKEHGYEVKKVKLMDMFPNTPHVETVVGLHRIDM